MVNITCAAAWAVFVLASYCGATSTTSPPTTSSPAKPAQELSASRGVEPADLGGAGAGREGRVEAVDVEGEIGRAVADDAPGALDHRRDAETRDLLGVDHRHAAES